MSSFPSLLIITWYRWKSWYMSIHKNEKTVSYLYLLQHLGEQALYLARTAQWSQPCWHRWG